MSNYEKITVAVTIYSKLEWRLCDVCRSSDFSSFLGLLLYDGKAPCEMTAYIMDSRLKPRDKGYLEEPLTDCAIYNRAIEQAEKSKQYTELLNPHALYFQKNF